MDSLRVLRNTLLRAALLSVVCSYMMVLVTFGFWDTWDAVVTQLLHIAPGALSRVVVLYFFIAVKFFNIFILLVPALALHWTIKSQKV